MKLLEPGTAVSFALAAGVLYMVAAQAGHWFVSSPQDASTARTLLVGVQLVAGVAIGLWAHRRAKRIEEEMRAEREERAGRSREPAAG